MRAPNHIMGGIAAVGIFASISGINILAKPIYLVVVVFASLLPDIDHTRSLIGKLLYPIAKPINRRYGHRTLTHSLIFLFFSTLLIRLLLIAFDIQGPYAVLFGAAYLSHLVFDMMTIQGVPLFYPFFNNPCVLPGKASMRLNTNNLRSETAIFCFFLLSLFFLQPLFSQGFWTSYNRLFGTMKHLRSEFHSSDDLLKCTVQYRYGTEVHSVTGYVLDVLPHQVILYDSTDFITIGDDLQSITHVAPSHTGLDLSYHTQSFYNIAPDSLTNLIYSYPITALEFSSNQPFHYSINQTSSTTKSASGAYINAFSVQPIIDTTTQPFHPDPRIHTNYQQLQLLRQLEKKDQVALQSAKDHLEALREQAQSETNLIQKEALINQINAQHRVLLSLGEGGKNYRVEMDRHKIQIQQLQTADRIRKEKHLADTQTDRAQYSGFYTYITIKPKPTQ